MGGELKGWIAPGIDQVTPDVRRGSFATKIDHSGHFRFSASSGHRQTGALGPLRANIRQIATASSA
jgi:hypothetical protein